MSKEYNHHQRRSFMPMLCLRPWTNDERLSKWDDEPASPRVGCMGQIKRNNKVAGFPTRPRCKNNNSNNGKYFKLKIFSTKSLRSRREMIMGGSSRDKYDDEEGYISISIVELDPPLPVIKPVQCGGGDAVSLWKRRCGRDSLKGLQLQQLRLPCHSQLNCLG